MIEDKELKPGSKNVTGKDLLRTAIMVIYMIALLIAAYSGYKIIAWVMGLFAAIFFFYSLGKIPKEELSRAYSRMERQKKTPIGRTLKYLGYVLNIIIGMCIIYWVIEKITR